MKLLGELLTAFSVYNMRHYFQIVEIVPNIVYIWFFINIYKWY
jgi:hypothetical protein